MDDKRANRQRLLQTLEAIAALFIVGGLVTFGAGARLHRQATQTAGWPAAPGRIITSEAVTEPLRGRLIRLVPVVHIVYHYQVGQTVYESTRVGVETTAVEAAGEEGQRLLRRYPAGEAVTVYYDPAGPTSAVLERDPPTDALRAGALLIVLGVGVLLLRRLLRGWAEQGER